MNASEPMRQLSIGKMRGLQQISNAHGFFTMTALDHRGSMQRMIAPASPAAVTGDLLTRHKRDLTRALAPVSSAVLIDPVYGAAQVIASGDLPRDTGLLVGIEATGYNDAGGARLTEYLPGWSVEKIKRMGASAAKILLYYRPGFTAAVERQRELLKRFIEDCQQADLPALVEPLCYPALPGDEQLELFAERRPGIVVETARELTQIGVDVLKAEFPTDARLERDEARMLEACQALEDASSAPWILLSGGVGFEAFATQVRVACQAGASGFLAGRAVWQEAMALSESTERQRWLETVAVERVERLTEIVGEFGRPWWRKWAATPEQLTSVTESWYAQF